MNNQAIIDRGRSEVLRWWDGLGGKNEFETAQSKLIEQNKSTQKAKILKNIEVLQKERKQNFYIWSMRPAQIDKEISDLKKKLGNIK